MKNITLSNNDLSVVIDQGELISFKKGNEELIHQKGAPGWRNSDTEMFPIIGPTVSNNFVVETPKGNCIQDQHGLLREFAYTVLESNKTSLSLQKEYKANTKIKNSKFPNKSTEEFQFWPYDFTFIKRYVLEDDHLKIIFQIQSEKDMPFMLGYHPAFKLSGNATEICKTNTKTATVKDVMDAGSTAFPFLNTDEITLVKENGHNVTIKTKGFNNFMLWTEVTNMLCIEPITEYPYTGKKKLEPNLFNKASGNDFFEVTIFPE
ncbi:aldose 1-epimerase [Tenacibaculum adriaticum]|uniref:Aldose 1-epimerase n=1 Tax=Tenacibaculum adriaticum TaxID=413713 RepID=A0A5S5DM04_9FLAO|nr:aldose 1-epimerase [Tenacibaculum adriaticum]TYP96755.1 aldose 1-epimerase [Tenacibaculum adriaticum]